jgi:hypothetical protein
MPRSDTRLAFRVLPALALAGVMIAGEAAADTAPQWLHALAAAPVPEHDDMATAVQMLSETTISVRPDGRIRRLERAAYRILRPEGQDRGRLVVPFDDQSKILDMHAWSIPASGKEYAVKERDVIESALPGIANGELVSDQRAKLLLIPAALPGNVVGYEFEQEARPYLIGDDWEFQQTVPVREARYTLNLPTGWGYRVAWVHHAPVEPASASPSQASWVVHDEAAIPVEPDMPPWRGIAARMVVTLVPPGGAATALDSWKNLGDWYANLVRGRRDASAEIRERVVALTVGKETPLAKIDALARFVQTDIRYVAIELGIGGQQPHPAVDVFRHRYGDCKDKVTLLGSMLKEIGVESYYVVINTSRGAVGPDSPPSTDFDHMIMAILLPAGVDAAKLGATVVHPALGRLLYFDPTDSMTPLGGLRGALQDNHALLVAPAGGELVRLPLLQPGANTVQRTGHLVLDADGGLRGDVLVRSTGDRAAIERYGLRSVERESDRLRPMEVLLAESVPNYRILDSKIGDIANNDVPFEWRLSIESPKYAKVSGDLLLVRPRLVGTKASGILETREARRQPIEFERTRIDSDTFDIEIPPHYEVDELPPPTQVDYPFGVYRSRTEVVGRTLRYRRTLEIRQLSVPAAQAGDLKTFYRAIHGDEGRMAVLHQVAN